MFHDKVTVLNVIGLGLAMAGSLAYNFARSKRTEPSVGGEGGKTGDT